MEDCKICFIKESNKTLSCNHTLCSNCCIRLNTSTCPFCRQTFVYTEDEIKQRKQLGLLNGYKYEVPPSLAFNFNQNIENRQLNIEIIYHEPYSRIRKNMFRNRRRALTFDEVLERRKIIKEKKARHWKKKDGRLAKIKWYEN